MLTQILQFIFSLTLLVLVHEFGHFIFAKIFGVRVEKFYIFFNPGFSIYKKKIGETEYGIGWLPLGGYVKLAGMIDESLDKKQLEKEPEPWEFRSKPAWQRLIIMLGGIFMNIILAFIIYISMLATWGTDYLPADKVKGIMVDSLGQELGLKNGDYILYVNGQKVKRFRDIYIKLILDEPHTMTVLRNDTDTVYLVFNNQDLAKILDHGQFFTPRFPFVIAGFADSSVAKKAGFEIGDSIIAFNSKPVHYFDQVKDLLKTHKGQNVTFTVRRNGKDTIIALTIPQSGKLGVYVDTDISKYYPIETEHYTLWQAIPAGIKLTFKQIGSYLKQFKLLFTPETKAYKSVGSFIAIGHLFPKAWDWQHFWSLTAFLSIVLAVVNLLPIPALDGGHALFALFEIITGRRPSDKFLEYAQILGMILLLLLIALAFWNDLTRFVFK
jgi:regulator of sigma E protease